jgi:ethanolamine-phosphate cytidylyltransferase
MFRELPSPSQTTTRNIIERIVANRAAFEARNAKKAVSEEKYYQSKDGKAGGGAAFVKEV